MDHGEIRFTLMTLVLAVTLGLIMSTFAASTLYFEHVLVKFGYAVPSLLLTVDMWAHYNRYYSQRDTYKHRDLFLDVLVLALSYIGLATLAAAPAGTDAGSFRSYPSQTFWIALVLYSLLKTYRAWPLYRPADEAQPRISWMSVLHIVLLLLILSAWAWQQGFPKPAPLPFAWSGVVFAVVAAVYLFAVYGLRWDPLTPVGRFRTWSE